MLKLENSAKMLSRAVSTTTKSHQVGTSESGKAPDVVEYVEDGCHVQLHEHYYYLSEYDTLSPDPVQRHETR